MLKESSLAKQGFYLTAVAWIQGLHAQPIRKVLLEENHFFAYISGMSIRAILKMILGLLLVAALAFGLWLGINRWPRPLEAELYTEQDLAIASPPKDNAWDTLPLNRDQIPPAAGDLDAPFPLKALFPEVIDSSTDAYEFWFEAKKILPALTAYNQAHSSALEVYTALLKFPHLVDDDPVSVNFDGFKVFVLLDLHKVAWTALVEQYLHGDPNWAYGFVNVMIQRDREWLETSRSLLSHMAAIGCLKSDLDLLLMMRYLGKPTNWQGIQDLLKNISMEPIQLQRALAFEYRVALKTMAGKTPGLLASKNWFLRVSYNPAFPRHDLNYFYRQLVELLKRPDALPDNLTEVLNRDMEDRKKGLFWWFLNPAGKTLDGLITIHEADYFKDFYRKKAALYSDLQTLLNGQFEGSKEKLATPESLESPEASSLPQDLSLDEQLKKAPEETLHKKLSASEWEAARKNDALFQGMQLQQLASNGKAVAQRIQSLDGNAFFHQLGFETGDVLLALQGHEMSGQRELEIFLEKPKTPDDKVEVLVWRGGKVLKLEFGVEAPPSASPPAE